MKPELFHDPTFARGHNRSDSSLGADVLEAIRAEQQLIASDIGVAAHDGVVTLFGEVDSLSKRSAAIHAASRVRGLRAVADEIVVRLGAEHLRTDSDIAHDAVDALMWDTEVPDKSVKVRVQDRWIWLVGHADWQYQRVAAERAVERIRGVKGVTNLVHLDPHDTALDVEAQIAAALRRDTRLVDRDIRVSVRDATVRLDGVVASWAERMAAEHAAWSGRGVRDVDNQLAVAPPGED